MNKLRVLLVSTLVLSLLGLPLVSTATADSVGTPVFNNPRGSASQQAVLTNTVERHVKAAKRGSVIRIAVYSFHDWSLTRALIRAHKRGVKVQLIVNHHRLTPSYKSLGKRLGFNIKRRSWVKRCSGSCRGPAGSGTQHIKGYSFSSTKTVIFGSANITALAQSGQYNDLFVARNTCAHHNFGIVFNQMKYDRPYSSRHFTCGALSFRVYPMSLSRSADSVARTLSQIGCKAGKGYGKRGRTLVSINMHGWRGNRGLYLAKKVRALHRKHCRVEVLYGNSVGRQVKNILRKVPSTKWRSGTPYSHLKVLMVSGKYGRDRTSKLVVTGSANWSDRYNRRDDLLVRIKSVGVYNSYRRQFLRMKPIYRR